MRFLETTDGRTYRLTEDFRHQSQVPAYAILSHTWEEDQEVTFDDINKDTKSKYRKLQSSLRLRPRSEKRGYKKLRFCAQQAKRDGLRFFWVDTCCIDKSNSSELQKAINSMFQWYQNAAKCYVYLSDVSTAGAKRKSWSSALQEAFMGSRWFTRGWTLQELLAPTVVEFFSKEGVYLGSRLELIQLIHDITNIPHKALSGASLQEFDADQKLSWAAERQTTREEDEVYALVGIFGIELPFIYDEGYDRALRRLLEKIYNVPGVSFQQEKLVKSTVPFGRDNDFVTRDSLVALHRIHKEPGKHAALVGLGGVGKSQIAIEYTYQVLDEVPDSWVFWVHAETKQSFQKSYQIIAEKIGIDGCNDPKVDVMQLVDAWLRNEANGRWIMVIDGADDAGVFSIDSSGSCTSIKRHSTVETRSLLSSMPRISTGSILVTSRSHEVASLLTGTPSDNIEVAPMTNQEAQALLRKKLNAAVQDTEADELIQVLDHMPLALTQASAFINRTPRMSVNTYLEGLYGNADNFLDKNLVDIRRYDRVSNSVMTTWQMSFDYVKERSPAAARLLSLMCVFVRHEIPAALLRDAYTSLEESADANFEEDIYLLTNLCLVKRSADSSSFEMHGIAQFYIKRWLESQNEWEYWTKVCLIIVNKHYPEVKQENWPLCQALLPHALAALERMPVDAPDLESWASLSHYVGAYMRDMGDCSKAYKMISDSYEVREILLGPDDALTLDSLNSLGLVLSTLERTEDAKDVLRKTLEGLKRTFGVDHTTTLTTALNLALIFVETMEWTEAEKMLEKVLQSTSKLEQGPTHQLTLSALAQLAAVYRDSGRLNDAAKLDLQVLETQEKHLGADHYLTIIARMDLASTYAKQGRLKEAETLQLQSIRTREAQGIDVDVELLRSKAKLARTYSAQGRLDEAEALGLQILVVSKEKLGPTHIQTMSCMSALASTYWVTGKLEESEALDLETLELRKTHLGEDHHFTLDTKSNLACTYQSRGMYAKAEALQSEVLESLTKNLGQDHQMTLDAKQNLATIFYFDGRLSEARQLREEVLKKRIEMSGPDHISTLSSMMYLAVTLRAQGHVSDAVELMRKCCEVYENLASPGSEDLRRFRDTFERFSREQDETRQKDSILADEWCSRAN